MSRTLRLLRIAADLLSDFDGTTEGPWTADYADNEYDRAIVELTGGHIGMSSDDYPALFRLLRTIKLERMEARR